MHYTQLTETQRYQIYALNKAKMTQSKMANILGVHKSTIYREIRRNSGLRGYRPKQAHGFALERKTNQSIVLPKQPGKPLPLLSSKNGVQNKSVAG